MINMNCQFCKNKFYAKPSNIKNGGGKYCSLKCYGYSNIIKIKRSCLYCQNSFKTIPSKIKNKKGKYCSIACLRKTNKGENHWNWRGGITLENHRIRNSKEYMEWRKAVFERDNYTCQICFKQGGRLEADHIKSFVLFSNIRFEVSNGRTLCKKCHASTLSYGVSFTKQLQYNNFILGV